MRKTLLLLISFLSISLVMGQNNRFSNDLKSRKLSYKHRTLKEKYQEDYFQQFFWVTKIEELKANKHLEKINPHPLYKVISTIYPAIPTKKLENEEEKKLRKDAALALGEYFSRKEYAHPIAKFNLETYVDPSGKKYVEHVNLERVSVLLKKTIYELNTYNTDTKEQKTYYVLMKNNRRKIETEFIDLIPKKEDNEKFYSELELFMPNYKFPKFSPSVKKGDKRDKKDRDYYYITPFEVGNNNIMYRTKDFKKFELEKIKKNGAAWQDTPERRKRYQSKR